MTRLLTTVSFVACLACLNASTLAQWGNLIDFFAAEPEVIDAFSIGQLLFTYRYDDLPPADEGVDEVDKMIAVGRATIHGQPARAMEAVIIDQLHVPHDFELVEAAAKKYDGAGFIWYITWHLHLAEGGSTGIPFRYTSLVAADGSLIRPDVALWDAYPVTFHRWLLSRLPLGDVQAPKDDAVTLYGDEILKLAKERLHAFGAELDASSDDGEQIYSKSVSRLRFLSQSLRDVPIGKLGHDGAAIRRAVWAVNFVDETRSGGDLVHADPFTIWVTPDGRVSELDTQ